MLTHCNGNEAAGATIPQLSIGSKAQNCWYWSGNTAHECWPCMIQAIVTTPFDIICAAWILERATSVLLERFLLVCNSYVLHYWNLFRFIFIIVTAGCCCQFSFVNFLIAIWHTLYASKAWHYFTDTHANIQNAVMDKLTGLFCAFRSCTASRYVCVYVCVFWYLAFVKESHSKIVIMMMIDA